MPADVLAGAAHPDPMADEMEQTLWPMLLAYGGGPVVRAIARLLLRRHVELNLQGDAFAARATRRAWRWCRRAGKVLQEEGV